MELPSLKPEQHSTILGYAIMAYGVGTLLDLVGPISQLYAIGSLKRSDAVTDMLWPKVLFGIAFFAVSLAAGSVIKNRDSDPKNWGLAIVFLSFGFFPLGSILSAYILVYLFVIDPKPDSTEPDNQIDE